MGSKRLNTLSRPYHYINKATNGGQPSYITPLMMAVSKLGTQGGGGGRILDPLLQRNIPPISNRFNDAVTRLAALPFSLICDYVERGKCIGWRSIQLVPSLQFQYVKTIYPAGADGKSGKWRNLVDSILTLLFTYFFLFPFFSGSIFLPQFSCRRNLAGK